MPSQRRSHTLAPVQAEPFPTVRKKTLLISQDLLDRARQALGVRTETDTVTRALEAVVQRERQIEGVRRLAAIGPIDGKRIG